MGEIVVRGGGTGAGYAPEMRALGGGAAGVRIFESDGFVAAEAEAVENEFVEVGLGLGRGDVFAAGEKMEAREEAKAGEVALAVFVAGVGGEGDGERAVARGVEEGDDAGEDGQGEVALAVEGAALGLEGEGGGAFFKRVPGIEGVIGVADGVEKSGLVEGHAVRGVDIGVCGDEGGLGVEDETVEVEDEGADHDERPTEYTEDTEANFA